jgi:hypothetical protein
MADFDDIVLADNGFQTRGSRQLLWDVWFVLRSKTGLGKLLNAAADRLLDRPLLKLGPDWKPTNIPTSTRQEITALPQNFKVQSDKTDALSKKVDALNASIPVAVNAAVKTAVAGVPINVTIDNQALATAVVNEFYNRMKSNTTTGA